MHKLPVLSNDDLYTLAEHESSRPKTRDDCLNKGINEHRPCPWVSCRYHLGIEVKGKTVTEVPNWDDGRETCALDVADEKAVRSKVEVAALMGMNLETISKTEHRAMPKLLRSKALKEFAE